MRILLSFMLVFLLGVPAVSAAPETDEMGPFPGAPAQPPATSYISNKNPALDGKERKALELSNQFANQQINPMLVSNGKVVFMHGATMPTVIAAPLQICDVELQPGEEVNEIMIGDSARWLIEVATSGSLQGPVTHLLIKPLNAGLETNAVITTDRLVYHMKLISRRNGHTPYVGFTYLQDIQRIQAERQQREEKREFWSSGDFDGQQVDLSKLNFNYDIKGADVNWKPERVYDDGRQMFIRLPARSRNGEIPVLLVRNGQKDVLVNYRVSDSTMIVDGIFDGVDLILGVGKEQQKIEIRRY
ncbi:MAG: P-type conjugative transfer protein TrbG [Desulfovibrionaceae bacterium]|nr:P-type conjugative transfer protein TrbG [Desulfovibrionaceae bacterium]